MLDPRQRRRLKQMAHALKPVVIVGQKGLGEAVLQEIEQALLAHELIKIKLAEADRREREALNEQISARIPGIETVQTIGRMAIFYRPNPKKKRPLRL